MKPIVQKVIAGGVILHDGKVLIIQRSKDDDNYPGLWEMPSGKKEDLETVQDAVRREVEEETGIEVEVVKILSVFNYKNEKENEIRDATQINFLVKPSASPEVKLSSEHDNYAWITKEEIDNYNISSSTKSALLLALENN